jgi:hypothetical protein
LTRSALRFSRGLVRGVALLLAATAGLAVLVACGAPRYTYVADSPAHAYFKVPSGWHAVSATALANALKMSGSGAWLSAFGQDSATASPGSVYSFDVSKPFVLAEVGGLNSQATDSLSYNALTDIFLPVTSDARSQAAGQLPVTNFQLLRQSMLTPGQGVHGVRVTYDYTWTDGATKGSTDTFDQVALTNADQTVLYLLIVHCTSACYSQNKNAINDIVSSFTVRSPL